MRCTAILRVLYLDEGGAPLMVERRTEVSARIAVPEGCTAAVRSVTACEVSAAATADGIEVRFPALFTLECTRRCRCACLCALKAEPQQESGGRQPTLVLRAMGAQERALGISPRPTARRLPRSSPPTSFPPRLTRRAARCCSFRAAAEYFPGKEP